MALILFSTTDMRGSRQADFGKMLASLERNARSGQKLRSYILLQNCSEFERSEWQRKAPAFCDLIASYTRHSLSSARNILIERAAQTETFERNDIVGFPDDDCWLPDHVAMSLAKTFSEHDQLDLLICRIASSPDLTPFEVQDVQPALARHIVRISTSNSMFMRASTFQQVGRFDEGLGVGTPNGGAEDTDFVIRAFLLSRQAGLIDRAVIAHPEPDESSAAKYYRGALVVLTRHADRSPGLMFEFLRKLLVGGYFVLRRRLSLRALLSAYCAASIDRRVKAASS